MKYALKCLPGILCWIIISRIPPSNSELFAENVYSQDDKDYDVKEERTRKIHLRESEPPESEYFYDIKEKEEEEYTTSLWNKNRNNLLMNELSGANEKILSHREKHFLKQSWYEPQQMKRKQLIDRMEREAWKNEDESLLDGNTDASLPDCNMTHLMVHIARLQVVSPENIIQLTSGKDVEEVCKTLETSLSDVDKYLATCKPPQQKELYMKLIKGIRTLDNTLCKDATFKADFIAHAPCYSNLTGKFNNCMGPADWLENPDNQEVCKTFTDIENCYYDKTKESCGEPTAVIIKKITKAIISSVITVDCNKATTTVAADTAAASSVASAETLSTTAKASSDVSSNANVTGLTVIIPPLIATVTVAPETAAPTVPPSEETIVMQTVASVGDTSRASADAEVVLTITASGDSVATVTEKVVIVIPITQPGSSTSTHVAEHTSSEEHSVTTAPSSDNTAPGVTTPSPTTPFIPADTTGGPTVTPSSEGETQEVTDSEVVDIENEQTDQEDTFTEEELPSNETDEIESRAKQITVSVFHILLLSACNFSYLFCTFYI